MCGKVYSGAKSTSLIIVKELCSAIRKHLKLLVILKLTKDKIKKIIANFESLHEEVTKSRDGGWT
jgi:hypothetical protein